MISTVERRVSTAGTSTTRDHAPMPSISQHPWTVVAHRQEGLLRYARARGVVTLPVRYAIWGHRLVLRLPSYNDASHFLDRADVALDVETCVAGRARFARVAGLALVVPPESLPQEVDAALDRWPLHVPTSVVAVVPETVSWLPVVDDARYPPLPDRVHRMPATFVS